MVFHGSMTTGQCLIIVGILWFILLVGTIVALRLGKITRDKITRGDYAPNRSRSTYRASQFVSDKEREHAYAVLRNRS